MKKNNTFKNYTKKCLGINLIKEVKDFYAENCKILIKKNEHDSKKWKYSPCSWVERILLKWPYYPKQSTDLM